MSNASASPAEHGPADLRPGDIDEDEAVWRARVVGYAQAVRAFDAEAFEAGDDEDSDQMAALAAGALVLASTMFIDEQIEDIAMLAQGAEPSRLAARRSSRWGNCHRGSPTATTAASRANSSSPPS